MNLTFENVNVRAHLHKFSNTLRAVIIYSIYRLNVNLSTHQWSQLSLAVDILTWRSIQICVAVSFRSSRGARSWSRPSASGTPKRFSIRPHVLVQTNDAYAMFKTTFSVFWGHWYRMALLLHRMSHPDLILTTASNMLCVFSFLLWSAAKILACLILVSSIPFIPFCVHTSKDCTNIKISRDDHTAFYIKPLSNYSTTIRGSPFSPLLFDGLFVWFNAPPPAQVPRFCLLFVTSQMSPHLRPCHSVLSCCCFGLDNLFSLL